MNILNERVKKDSEEYVQIQVLNNKYTSGCSYSHRCQYFSKECEIVSDLITVNSNHKSSCVRNNIIK